MIVEEWIHILLEYVNDRGRLRQKSQTIEIKIEDREKSILKDNLKHRLSQSLDFRNIADFHSNLFKKMWEDDFPEIYDRYKDDPVAYTEIVNKEIDLSLAYCQYFILEVMHMITRKKHNLTICDVLAPKVAQNIYNLDFARLLISMFRDQYLSFHVQCRDNIFKDVYKDA